jgi:hypothetical protein
MPNTVFFFGFIDQAAFHGNLSQTQWLNSIPLDVGKRLGSVLFLWRSLVSRIDISMVDNNFTGCKKRLK